MTEKNKDHIPGSPAEGANKAPEMKGEKLFAKKLGLFPKKEPGSDGPDGLGI